MNNQEIRTFFCIAYNEVSTVEDAMAMINRLPANPVFMRSSILQRYIIAVLTRGSRQ